jgi:hypothetical protein
MSTPEGTSEPERTPTLSFDKQAEPADGDQHTSVLNSTDEPYEPVEPAAADEPSFESDQPVRQPETAITVQRPVRMRTVVVGLVFLVITASVLVNQLTDITLDAGAVFLAVMIGGGVLLIIGAAPRLSRGRRASQLG